MNTAVLRSDDCETKIGKILKSTKEIDSMLLLEYWKHTMKYGVSEAVMPYGSALISKGAGSHIK